VTDPFAIVPYPLSGAYMDRLERKVGEPLRYLDVPSLRRLGHRALLEELRQGRGRPCFLPLEDPSSMPLLPIVTILAALSGASSIEVVGPDLERRRISAAAALPATGRLCLGTLRLQAAARRARRELRELERSPRVETRASKRSVVYLNANLWYGLKAGGSVAHVAGVVNALLERGFPVDVAAAAPQPLVDARAGFVQLSLRGSFGLPSELNQYAFSQSAADLLGHRAGAAPSGLIYQRHSFGSYAGAAVSRSTRIPLVLEYNGSEVWVARHWGRPSRDEPLALAAEEVSLRHAHLVVTVSHVLGDELRARGVEDHRLLVQPNGVDQKRFDPGRLEPDGRRVRDRLGLPPEAIVVAFVGTFGHWHGAEVLAQVARVLAENDPEWVARHTVRFLFVGDGIRLPAVRRELGRHGGAVSLLPGLVAQPETPSYLAAADIVVSPHVPNDDGTPFFGSPTKLFEYMIMAKGIVASDLEQIGDVLRPALDADELPTGAPQGGYLAVLARPGDPESLCRGIRFLVERPDWRSALGGEARRRALTAHTWTHHVDAIIERLASLDLIDPAWRDE
jgi:glycosyltransferase involved in cell wall biosynthesis